MLISREYGDCGVEVQALGFDLSEDGGGAVFPVRYSFLYVGGQPVVFAYFQLRPFGPQVFPVAGFCLAGPADGRPFWSCAPGSGGGSLWPRTLRPCC